MTKNETTKLLALSWAISLMVGVVTWYAVSPANAIAIWVLSTTIVVIAWACLR